MLSRGQREQPERLCGAGMEVGIGRSVEEEASGREMKGIHGRKGFKEWSVPANRAMDASLELELLAHFRDSR